MRRNLETAAVAFALKVFPKPGFHGRQGAQRIENGCVRWNVQIEIDKAMDQDPCASEHGGER